jgi:dihydrolipoamide dehydrogenase
MYDIIIIGGGPGGYVAAIKAGQLGNKVLLIEKEEVGGVCLNWGCIPTKAMLKTAKVYNSFLHAESYGLEIKDPSTIKVNLKSIKQRKDKIVTRLTTGVKGLLKKANVEIVNGFANAISPYKVEVNNKVYETKKLIVATGSHPFIPPIPGLHDAFKQGNILTAKELLALEELPKELVIVGGGVIGVEFATLYSNLGAKVTLLERQENLLTTIDDEVRTSYLKLLKNTNLTIYTNASVEEVSSETIKYRINNQVKTITYDKLLLSVGVRANTKGLESLHLEQENNFIKTNNKLETSVKDVYAIGDINGKMMLAHVASAEGIIAVENINNHNKEIDYNRVPSGIYGFPEIAYVGKTEQTLQKEKIEYKKSIFPLAANGKALAEGEANGFIKVLADKEYGELLGVHILSMSATDMISEAVTTMELEGTVYEIAKAIHPHPTLSEIVMEAAHGIIDKPIHI